MRTSLRTVLVCITVFALASAMAAQTSDPNSPTWWNKYQQLANGGPAGKAVLLGPLTVGANVDASNECGPQSETYITLNPNQPQTLAAGSNEIFRLPMRGYSRPTVAPPGVEWICRCRRLLAPTERALAPIPA